MDTKDDQIDILADDADELDVLADDISVQDVEVDESLPMSDEEMLAYKILKRAATLKGVTVERDTFLRTELSKKYPSEIVDVAVASSPREAGILLDDIDALADASINLETNKVSGLSMLAGIPGGLALFGTIPADVMNYFAHALRIEQKLAYLYGWESFLDDQDEVDDETMARLIVFLGVMMQVGGAGVSLSKFASTTASKGVARAIERQALTKTAWYNPLKKVLSVLGVKLTKSTFAETVAKGVPVVGGVISGGLTYATFKPGAVKLKKYLRSLPPATGIDISDDEFEVVVERIEEESRTDFDRALEGAGIVLEERATAAGIDSEKVVEIASSVRDSVGSAAQSAIGGIGRMAGTVANGAAAGAGDVAAGVMKGIGSLSWSPRRAKTSNAVVQVEDESIIHSQEEASFSDVADELRSLKALLDEGVITQDDFDAKKRLLLGI